MSLIEIFINGNRLQIAKIEDVGIRLEKSIVDFRNPFERKGDFSYTVQIPTTPHNNNIFRNVNNPYVIDKFNLPVDYVAELVVNGANLISGKFILKEINKFNYKGNFVSSNVNWADELSNKTLRDLNFPEIPFNGLRKFKTSSNPAPDLSLNLTQTWDESTNPYWDYFWITINSYGNFYKSGAADRKKEFPALLSWQDLTPNFSFLKIFEQIFKDIGYNISGDFVNDPDVQRLMLAYSGDFPKWNWKHIAYANMRGTNQTVNVVSTPTNKSTKADYIKLSLSKWDYAAAHNTQDPNSNGGVGWEYNVPVSGKYRISLNIRMNIRLQKFPFIGAPTNPAISPLRDTVIGFHKSTDGDLSTLRNAFYESSMYYSGGLWFQKNYRFDKIQDENLIAYFRPTIYYATDSNAGSTYVNPTLADKTGNNSDTTIINYNNQLRLNNLIGTNITDYYYYYDADYANKPVQFSFETYLQKGEIVKLVHLNRFWGYHPGLLSVGPDYINDLVVYDCVVQNIDEDASEQFKIQDNLPDISQRDFIKEVIKQFNLYYLVDDVNKHITFLKRQNFFSKNPNLNVNLSDKVNLSEATFTPVSTFRKVRYGLITDDSDDFAATNFQEIDRQFNYSVYSNEVLDARSDIFAPSLDLIYSIASTAGQIKIPTLAINDSIYQLRSEVEWDFKVKPRLLFRGQYVGNNITYTQNVNQYKISNTFTTKVPLSEFRNSKPNGMQLNFSSTEKSIYTEYHIDRFQDLSKSHLVSVPARLTSVDYSYINMREPIFVDNEAYYVNKIVAFDPINLDNTIIELIKIT